MQKISYLEKWVAEHNQPKYRAKQIYQSVTKNLISNWDEAIELPKEWHEILNKELPISTLKVKRILPDDSRRDERPFVSTDAKTIKIAFETQDDLIIESVLMRHDGERNTVCVSTQIGCPMNCAFCATGKLGFTRNLTAEEIVDQVLEFGRILKNIPVGAGSPRPGAETVPLQHVTNIVFMGMGEPFLNYENVMKAIKILNDKDGFNLGSRHITISTSGIVPGILRFADEDIQVNLAISLHAPNDKIRDNIMPVNKKYPLVETNGRSSLLDAVKTYMTKTNRKVFFEYILLKGINDSNENIHELIALLKKYFANQMQLVHVNLIEYNEIPNSPNSLNIPKSPNNPKRIADLLQKNGVLATIRYRFGNDINAACGQLAGK